jgi:hypothetical protein
MNTTGSEIAERQFITKEFADTLAGKIPAPYLRLHDRVQNGLAGLAADLLGRSMGETAYLDRMIHFWCEVSLAGLRRTAQARTNVTLCCSSRLLISPRPNRSGR